MILYSWNKRAGVQFFILSFVSVLQVGVSETAELDGLEHLSVCTTLHTFPLFQYCRLE